MQIKHSTSYVLITADESLLADFTGAFELQYNTLKNNHLFVDLTKLEPLKPKELNNFLAWAKLSRALKKSFIIIIQNISVDKVSENLICVPTLLEAEDTLQMEAIERDLGF